MNAMLLALGLRLCGRRLTVRLLPAALVGALYALLCALQGDGPLSSLPAQGAAMLLMLWVADGHAQRGKARLAASMAMGTLFVGGTMEWLSPRFPGVGGHMASAAAGCVALCLWRDRRQMRLTRLTVRVYVRQPQGEASFEALIDTGNRLREPVSGLPVMIAEERLLVDVLPADGRGLRHIPFGGLGGCGFLEAFRPQEVRFQRDERWQEAPGVWLAVYRGRMSGRVHALAPPAFALENRDG